MSQAYKLQQVEFAWGKEVVLRLDDFHIEENTVYALVGPNGSGKSTLLNLLAFVNRPTAGQMVFFGKAVTRDNIHEFRRHIAYVQQKPYLFNLTVLQNIELGLKLRGIDRQSRRRRAEAVAATLQLQALLEKRAHELSGGEIQKVAIARALVLEPRILLLDEPFTHLDRQSRQDMESLLQALKDRRSQTIVFSSHDPVLAQNLADQVCSLERGNLSPRLPLNTFSGRVDVARAVFDSGKLQIQIPASVSAGTQIAIDSKHLVLSKNRLESSMRNHFQGRVRSLQDINGEIHLGVEAGEYWQVIITRAALQELEIAIGEPIWLSFKSTAVQVF